MTYVSVLERPSPATYPVAEARQTEQLMTEVAVTVIQADARLLTAVVPAVGLPPLVQSELR